MNRKQKEVGREGKAERSKRHGVGGADPGTNYSEIVRSEAELPSPSRPFWQARHNVAGGSAARRALSMRLPHSRQAPFLLKNSRALFSNFAAQTNSVARIASPRGMTIKAGPGNTIMATPTSNTENPMTATTARLSNLRLGSHAVICDTIACKISERGAELFLVSFMTS